jgi:hypothetical protein
MLPNFTVVICGAILTVVMLAVTGSGLITPETRKRIGEMPEVGRPMMQHMIAEPAGQARFMVSELSRRAEELARLRDLVTPAPVAEPVAAVRNEEAAPAAAQEAPQAPAQMPARAAVEIPTRLPAIAEDPIAPPIAPETPAVDVLPAPAAVPALLAAPSAAPAAPLADGETASSSTVVALAEPGEVAPTVHLPARPNARLPLRAQPRPRIVTAKVAVATKTGVRKGLTLPRRPVPVHHAIHRPQHRHRHRAYAVGGGTSFPYDPDTQFR